MSDDQLCQIAVFVSLAVGGFVGFILSGARDTAKSLGPALLALSEKYGADHGAWVAHGAVLTYAQAEELLRAVLRVDLLIAPPSLDGEWHDRYMREVEGLNNEGDPIGGDPPRGLRHLVDEYAASVRALTELMDEHPGTYEGPCWCVTCRSYMAEDCATATEAQP